MNTKLAIAHLPATLLTASVALTSLALLGAGCTGSDVGSDDLDAASIPYADGSPEGRAILDVANDRDLDVTAYDDVVGLHKKAAENLIEHRDRDPNTDADDNPFDDLSELWTVSYCKTTCFNKLLDYAKATGVYGGNENVSVVFSPQPSESTHLQKIADWIDDEADETIDIAMYSYSHSNPVRGALERAVSRGVKVRFLADDGVANSSSKAGGLEEMGIDVRRVTKVMHHKFAIIDGPRDDSTLDRAATAHVITGSGNWSSSAGTIYDENTLFLTAYPELALRMQRDFDTIWAGSKDKVYNDTLEWDQTRADITDALIAQHEDEDTHAWFTSFNFKSNSNQSWSYLGTTHVTDQLVAGILSADESIEIASGHFVSLPIAQAVEDALSANPNLSVRVVIDCQEVNKNDDGIGTIKKNIENLGGRITYKCNTYRWHYKYAKQMHHKYVIVDGDELFTGSLNFSDNSETNVFENVLYFSGAEHRSLVDAYQANFEMVSSYGQENDGAAYDAVMEEIETGDFIPLIWDPAITMSADDFNVLKDAIRDNCPATVTWIQSPAEGAETYDALVQDQPQWFTHCARNGYPWPNVPQHMRVD